MRWGMCPALLRRIPGPARQTPVTAQHQITCRVRGPNHSCQLRAREAMPCQTAVYLIQKVGDIGVAGAVGSPPDVRRRNMIAGMAASFGGRNCDSAEAGRQAALRGMPHSAGSLPVSIPSCFVCKA